MPLVYIKHTFIQTTIWLASAQICMPDNTLTYPWSYMIYKSLIYHILNAVIIAWCTINWIVGTPGTLNAKFLPRRTLWRVRMWYYVEDSIFENSDDEEGILEMRRAPTISVLILWTVWLSFNVMIGWYWIHENCIQCHNNYRNRHIKTKVSKVHISS